MHYSTLFLSTLLGLATAIPTAGNEPDKGPAKPNSKEITIQQVNYAGSGCPAGSLAGTLNDDRTLLTLTYDKYVAQSGPGIAPADNRKNCQLTLKLQYPQGFQYSIFTADYRGYAAIKKGASGTCKTTYYFSGSQSQASLEANFKGPFEGDYLKHDELGVTSVVWSPCGAQGMLNMNTQVRVTPVGTNSENLMTLDSTDLKFESKYSIQWRKCPGH